MQIVLCKTEQADLIGIWLCDLVDGARWVTSLSTPVDSNKLSQLINLQSADIVMLEDSLGIDLVVSVIGEVHCQSNFVLCEEPCSVNDKELLQGIGAGRISKTDSILKSLQHLSGVERSPKQAEQERVDDPIVESSDSEPPITRREQEILTLVSNGYTSREIAQRLNITERTVQNHRSRLMKKLSARTAAEMIRTAAKNGLLLI